MTNPAESSQADIIIVGGGPAGMMAGLLFARAGLRTVVLEKHADFLRDFRGDTVHPSTLDLFDQLGLLDAFLARPHDKVSELRARIGGRDVRVADFSRLPVRAPFIAMMPQWHFLDFIADAASRYPGFTLLRECEAVDVVIEDGRVVGVATRDGRNMRGRLIVAADGRSSKLRAAAGLEVEDIGAPMDVFWFRLPKARTPENGTGGVFATGQLLAKLDRGDYWQCAFVFAKGTADRLRGEGLDAFRARIARIAPELADAVDVLTDWDHVKLLSVSLDRLKRWHRPGLLCIGDAAHAISPIGGVGINLAVQDAVAAANILAGPMAAGRAPDTLLAAVQARRELPVRVIQRIQKGVQDNIVAAVLAGTPVERPPLAVRLLDRVALLRRIPAWLIGMGIRRERIRSPAAT
ncbi:MAG TPA: FAD-dependent oxidoreductase [Mesorhizobium sp.]|nr:FAD-dependent oxidoreductase [Mesorhizobium sp.]